MATTAPVLSAPPMSGIYAKLVAVYEDVKYIKKDKKNAFFNYTYASEAAIKDHLHEAFAKHGLLMLPPEVLSIEDVDRTDDKGKVKIITTAHIRFGIADRDSGESVSGTVFGRGEDASDKGIYKAITGGLKYFLTTTFLIPTGDDPEEADKAPAQKPRDEAAKPTRPVPIKQPHQEPKRPSAAAAPSESDVPLAVQDAWKRMGTKISSIVAVFGEYKKQIENLTGSDIGYYAILSRHKMNHANDCMKVGGGASRLCVRELYEEIEKLKAVLIPPPDSEENPAEGVLPYAD